MTGLPSGWASTQTIEICAIGEAPIQTGPFGSNLGKNDFTNSGVPVFTIGALGWDGLLRDRFRFVSETKATELASYRLKEGDLLFSRMADVGRVGFVPSDLEGAIFNYHIMRLRLNMEVIDPEYFRLYIRGGLTAKIYMDDVSRGATRDGINTKLLAALPVDLAPLPEQRRIVRKLDTLSARTTTARTHLTAIEKLVERYKVGVLGQLFGKSGSDPKPTEHLWAIPSNWSWKKVKDIGDVGLGRQRSPENHNGPLMRPYIRSANITWRGVDVLDVKEMNFDEADFERFQLVPGEVLLNEGSGSAKEVGKPAIWRGEIPDCCYQNTVLRVQPRNCTSEYLYWYFLLTARSEGFVGDTKGVNIQHIGKNGLANFPIPVPPLDEQREIVGRIETAFAKIDRLAAEAAKALKLVGHLDQRILAKAFAGELVPQEPTDEPAETLLARIRAAREAAPKAKRRRRTSS